ncbi:hypothetical protein AbraIFM66950_001252 [Aspergillus brasiliensis]|nr:hypothetical protein AbraIFM66950_001252 [Aspergillus brasiliensis]
MTEVVSENRGLRFKPVYLSQLNATEIFIWKNCTFGIYWVDAFGEKHKFVMCAPQSSQGPNSTGRKFIFFTKDGIDVRDEAGFSCLSYSGSLGPRNLVTFPVQRLSSSQATAAQNRDLIYLWQLETGLDWNMTISQMAAAPTQTPRSHDTEPLPKAFFIGKGRELIRANWYGDKLQPYQQPPQPADETWILLRCLQEHWPAGGMLFIGDPVKWPARADDNIWVHLKEFVNRPKYHNHPRIAQLQAWVQDVWHQQKTRQMMKNIGCLYYITDRRKIQERDRKRMSVEMKDVKIAGTELKVTPRWPDTILIKGNPKIWIIMTLRGELFIIHQCLQIGQGDILS